MAVAVRTFEQFHIGERLRRAREARGVDLERASADTRIDRGYLEALEHDAPAEAYPGPVFARAFLREYARYLGLNPRPLVDAYRATHPERDWPFLGGPEPIDSRRRWTKGALVATLLVAAVSVTIAVARRDADRTPAVPDIADSPPIVARGGQARERETLPPPVRGVHLRIRLVDEVSWLGITAGNRDLISETQRPGFARTFHDPRALSVVIGNADAARVTLNGKPLELVGAEDEVYRADIRFRNGRVRVTPEP